MVSSTGRRSHNHGWKAALRGPASFSMASFCTRQGCGADAVQLAAREQRPFNRLLASPWRPPPAAGPDHGVQLVDEQMHLALPRSWYGP